MNIILGIRTAPSAKPYAQLDELYLGILQNAVLDADHEDVIDRFQKVVGTILVSTQPPSLEELEGLAGLDPGDAREALYHLHSVVFCPESDDEPAHVHHPSFSDFLTNPSRCNLRQFLVDVNSHKQRLAFRCFEVIAESTKEKVKSEEDITLELKYACRNWTSYLPEEGLGDGELVRMCDMFATEHIRSWLHIMMILDERYDAGESVMLCHAWLVRILSGTTLPRCANILAK